MKLNFIRSGGNDRRKSLGTPGRVGCVPEKTDEQLAKTDAKLDRIAEMLGGISNNQGKSEVSLTTKVRLPKNFFTTPSNTIQCWSENNLILSSGMSLVPPERARKNTTSCFSTVTPSLIEVRYRVHPKDIETLIKRKGGNFPLLLSQYRDFQRHLGSATFSIEDAVLKEALNRGVTVLQRRGDLIETISAAA